MMSFASYTETYAPNDPSWLEAFKVADSVLSFTGNDQNLIRMGWRDQLSNAQALKILGFSKFNVGTLFAVAAKELSDLEPTAKNLEHVLNYLGMRYSVAILAVNYTCSKILFHKPAPIWRTVLNDMMCSVEIGSRFGSKVPTIGLAGGTLIGFIKGAGLGILLAYNQKEFKKWFRMSEGVESRALSLKVFGCEPYQVAAAAVQLLGFGREMAVGTALGMGRLNSAHLEISEDVMAWKACYLWLESLREGRSFPGPLEIRNYFRELAPPREPRQKNQLLEVLYTEIAAVKRHGSKINWHLTGIELSE